MTVNVIGREREVLEEKRKKKNHIAQMARFISHDNYKHYIFTKHTINNLDIQNLRWTMFGTRYGMTVFD